MKTSSQPVLVMEDVSKQFGKGDAAVHALVDVDLTVNLGEILVLMGPSGAGKTTLLTIAGALQRPTTGRVLLLGTDVTIADEKHLPRFRRETVGFIFQHFNLIGSLTAVDNVALVMSHGNLGERRARAREMLLEMDLEGRGRFRPKVLSGGEKQRVAIARALANDPELILADEPVSSLDASRVDEVLDQFQSIAHDLGKAVVIISHDPRVRQIGDRTLWLQDGVIQPSHEFGRESSPK